MKSVLALQRHVTRLASDLKVVQVLEQVVTALDSYKTLILVDVGVKHA